MLSTQGYDGLVGSQGVKTLWATNRLSPFDFFLNDMEESNDIFETPSENVRVKLKCSGKEKRTLGERRCRT